MTAATVTLEDFDLDDRAKALVGWASRWDEIHAQLTSGGYHPMHDAFAEASLVAAITPFAHPLLDSGTVTELIRDLRDAVNQKLTYETYGFLPDGWDEKYGPTYDSASVEDDLDKDINLSLWPLLTGLSTTCHECVRTRLDVTTWKPPVIASRCEGHRLLVAPVAVVVR
jgi:hypothetical protein